MGDSYFVNSRLAKRDPLDYVIDKDLSCKTFLNYMNLRLQKMFAYDGLPDTLPKEMFENYLLNNGTCFITEVEGKLYALLGSFGGPPDPYYRPTLYVVANPALRLSKSYDINEDGVLMRNDSLWTGLYPLMCRYAALMAENMLTLRTADVLLRVMVMITAPDDKTKIAAEEYLKNLENGKLGIIGESRFFDEGVKMQSPPSNNGSYLTQFIELHQYLIGTFYNEIGLNANFNMKRESIGDGESSLNEDSLLPLAEQMLKCREEDVEKINAKYGTSITVKFDSAWANNQKEVKLGLEKLEVEASQLAGESVQEEASQLADETVQEDESEVVDEKVEDEETSEDVEEEVKEGEDEVDDGHTKDWPIY